MDKVKNTEEIKVLDKGKNIDIGPVPMAFCCGGLIIPFRW